MYYYVDGILKIETDVVTGKAFFQNRLLMGKTFHIVFRNINFTRTAEKKKSALM